MRDTTPTLMFITSYWPEGDVHLPRAELGIAPPGHRTRLHRRYRRRNLAVTADAIEFDTHLPDGAPAPDLVGMRTRIEFTPIPSTQENRRVH